jgi:chemotaxis protein methyltransferase WspC
MIEQVEAMLKRRIGLDAESIGRSAIEHAVRVRRVACGKASLADYIRHLEDSASEQQALVDTVVVPETWFFRAREAIDAMAGIVVDRRFRTGRPQRLLSLPCSTGEEPYSIAMALLDAGLAPEMFHIDGIDISARSLNAAAAAHYGRNAFRSDDLSFRDRWFEATPAGHQLIDRVRAQVRFAIGNLIDPLKTLAAGSYDIIFCRNVLIYFDPATQDHAVDMLTRLLVPDGLLFVGASEASLPLRRGYASMRIPMAAAFRKGGDVPDAALKPRSVKAKPRVGLPPSPVPARPAMAPAPIARPARVDPAPLLDEVQRLADLGRLDEALPLARDCLHKQGPSTRLFYLLGLLSDAAGDLQHATTYYRKALYLDPSHPEALAHLALLREKMGDKAGAGALRGRLNRRLVAG